VKDTTSSTSLDNNLERTLLLEKFEPIAIIGVGMRLPGDNDSPAEFAEFLRAGGSGTISIPKDRWNVEGFHSNEPGAKGKTLQAAGGFISGIDQFDPKFFNISPKEADFIDPQHRLLLECAWTALESANIDPASLRDSDGGVYVGIGQYDWALDIEVLDPGELEGYMGAGTAHSGACGRVSYFLGWRGPCISIDTACSASLTAMHLAVQGLRRRECSIALCGGVNVIHHPRNHIMFSLSNMLSADGKCKTFDDSADGYGRSEGCAVFALKRLSDAKRDGDPILALVRGSSVRQDGESGGLTVPNGNAQIALMRQALESAMLEPRDIQYVEAHGTGTPLGDPIEMGAIDSVFSDSHNASAPILVGSVKTNIGHMEAAAGVGGLLKVVMQLQESTIFPHINMDKPSRHIPWDRYCVAVPTEVQRWDAPRKRALVNSFGFAGTIATVVLEQAPPPAKRPDANGEPTSDHASARTQAEALSIFTVSAKNQAALRLQLAQFQQFVSSNPNVSVGDLCYTANIGRTHFNARFACVASSQSDLLNSLDKQLAKLESDSTVGDFRGSNIAFLFTGQGSQYVGMGRTLYAQYPVFQQHLNECDNLFSVHLGKSIKALMFGELADSDKAIHQTQYTQPALFALEYALAKLWISWGVTPTILLGHSIGEIVAATIAGLFTLPDAIQLVSARARLMQSVSAAGGMVAVRASADGIAPALNGYKDVSFGAINAPEQCVISGGLTSLATISAILNARGIETKALPVSHAFHSPLMTEVFTAFREELKHIVFHEPCLSFISNLTGRVATLAEVGTIEYWVRHIGEPVNFAAGMRCVQARGRHVFVEVGPSAALVSMGRQFANPSAHLWLSSLTPGNDEQCDGIRRALAQAYMAGLPIAWIGYHQDRPGHRIAIPTYAFDKKRYWFTASLEQSGKQPGKLAGGLALIGTIDHHPLLGREISTGAQRQVGIREFRAQLFANSPGYLLDHIVMGQVVFPGAGYVEILLALQDAVFGETSRLIEDMRILEPLFLNEETATDVITRMVAGADGYQQIEIASRVGTGGDVFERRHVSARLGAARDREPSLQGVISRMCGLADQHASETPEALHRADDVYAKYADLGLPYGPEFQRVKAIKQFAGKFAIGDLRGINTPAGEHLRASVLDCAMQTLAGVADLRDAYLPVGFDRIELLKRPKEDLRCMIQLTSLEEANVPASEISADIVVLEGDRTVFVVNGLRLKRVANNNAAAQRLVHEPRWVKRSLIPGKVSSPRQIMVMHRNSADFKPLTQTLADSAIQLKFCSNTADLSWLLAENPEVNELCWFWRIQPELQGQERLQAECFQNYNDLLEVVGHLDRLQFGRTLRILLVTEGAQWLPGDVRDDRRGDALAAGSLWGFGHVLLNEYPTLRATLIDLPAKAAQASDYTVLVDEWLAADIAGGEYQVGYRQGLRHASAQDKNFELKITEFGQFANIKPVTVDDVAPLGDEVTVEVHAAGLNFKDVLNALGMLKQYAIDNALPYNELPLGFEASGRVIASGLDAEFRIGDEVVLSQLGCMKKRVTLSSTMVVRKPANIDFAEAAGLSAAYVTAYYALHDLAKIKAGDKVLIHAAAGGVGQAAVQLAKMAGAEVFATASPRKWGMLRSQGVKHIMNSRNLDFTKELLWATEGDGVDIVLNSLNKEYVPASLSCLGQCGRFVELGKIGIWSTEQMNEVRPDVSYHNFDLSEFDQVELNRINKHILETVTAGIVAGALHPLPTVSYSLDEIEEAFGVLSQGRNVGKIILNFRNEHEQPERPITISADHTYLVTGGMGALGVVALRKLASEGAKHLAVVSRRKVDDKEILALASELGRDVELTMHQGDIGKAEDVTRIMAQLAQQKYPLAGVIHTAGVLADGVLNKQTWKSFDQVLQSKMYGTWNLHQATAHLPDLQFFVAYSSVSSVFGAAGQSNYAAGNSFMDTLMHWRVMHGLPGLSINWGPWAEVGMAVNLSTQQIRSIEERGIMFVKPAEGMRAMVKTLARHTAQAMICEFDWDKFVDSQPVEDALYKLVVSKNTEAEVGIDLEALLAQPKVDRDAAIRSILRAKVANVLRFDSPEDVEVDAKFIEMGLDSLSAVEFKNALESVFRIPLPTSILFDYPAVTMLTEFISQKLVPNLIDTGAVSIEEDMAMLSDEDADEELAALREFS
jgi:acyl transferase domain-containing protein/acyl carrier protein